MSVSRADSRAVNDAVAGYREDFVRVVACVGLDSHQAACLVEAMSGRRFQACGPADLAPALAHLAALAERLRVTHFLGSHACDD